MFTEDQKRILKGHMNVGIPSFHEWLVRRNLKAADHEELRHDIMRDKSFPRHAEQIVTVLRHLESKGASRHVMQVLRSLWPLYEEFRLAYAAGMVTGKEMPEWHPTRSYRGSGEVFDLGQLKVGEIYSMPSRGSRSSLKSRAEQKFGFEIESRSIIDERGVEWFVFKRIR
jgi:uncharacterized protein YozE (UPF0346 family)